MTAFLIPSLKRFYDETQMLSSLCKQEPELREALVVFRRVTWLFRDKLFASERVWNPIVMLLAGSTALEKHPQFVDEIFCYVMAKLCVSYLLRFREYFVLGFAERVEYAQNELPHRDLVSIIRSEVKEFLVHVVPDKANKKTKEWICLAKNEIVRLYQWSSHPLYNKIWNMGVDHEIAWRCRVLQLAFDNRRGLFMWLQQEHVDIMLREIEAHVLENPSDYLKPSRFVWAKCRVQRICYKNHDSFLDTIFQK